MNVTGKSGTSSFRVFYAATLDGTIDGRPVHGARRSISRFTTPGHELLRGTEFDAAGSRSFLIHNHYTVHSNGRVTNWGTGTWLGGTGAYRGGRGRFTITGGGSGGGVGIIRVKGYIVF